MKVLLTGASGFIGGYFYNHYKSKLEIKTFSFLKNQIEGIELHDIDAVIHCGALAHKMNEIPYEDYYKSNVEQTIKLASIAKKNNVSKFIFISTVKVYGEETNLVLNENSLPNPLDSYSRSKYEAEKKLIEMEDENFKISILRIPLAYGIGVKANFKSLVNLVKKSPILPLGRIKNKRSLVYVGNVANILYQITIQNKNGIFIALDDKPISTSTLIHEIARALNKKNILFKIPFFDKLVRLIKPNIYKRLFMSLEIDNSNTLVRLGIEKNKFMFREALKETLNNKAEK